MTFRIGQKVVCINCSPSYSDGRACPLTRGRIYEVAATTIGPLTGALHLQVCGLDPFFHHNRFRPVVDKSTDISFAHEILRKASRTRERVA